ncbi:hypothetical protein [Bradyrhizobium centrolobii]|uniref:hypothetical protein n=1 Tax=Bradyrhizobium centrolobii TaxID=1505087 RepID=UPI0010A94FD3|nr:hypothetical protein [Bradyrhizobium centrolobii]
MKATDNKVESDEARSWSAQPLRLNMDVSLSSAGVSIAAGKPMRTSRGLNANFWRKTWLK